MKNKNVSQNIMTTPDFLVLGKLAKHNIYPLSPLDRVIYKYVSYDTVVKIIEDLTIKFSSPNSFNDPFEFTLDLLDTRWTKADLKTFLDNRNDLTKFQKKQLFNDNLNQLSNLKKLTDDLLTKDKENIGISCFSLSFEKTLMWSHYADKHGGICLGFRLPSFMPNAIFFYAKS